MKQNLSPKQVARAIGVSESSLKRWCDKGLLHPVRTAGGHRRLPVADVLQFVRQTGQALERPEVLGLPAAVGRTPMVWERAFEQFQAGLVAGDETLSRQAAFDLYLAGHGIVEIGDGLVARAFREIGSRWEHGALEVFEERRAVEICLRLLFELRAVLSGPPGDAPLALGGTPETDPYRLPTTLIEVALRESGWRAESYGVSLPLGSLAEAVRRVRPRLVWLSVSHLADEEAFVANYAELFEAAHSLGAAVALGGNGLTPELRTRLRFSSYCENLRQLLDFAHSLWQPPVPQLDEAG